MSDRAEWDTAFKMLARTTGPLNGDHPLTVMGNLWDALVAERDEAFGVCGSCSTWAGTTTGCEECSEFMEESGHNGRAAAIAEAAEARVTELEAAINRALTSIGMEFYGGRRGQTAEILRAALAAPTKEDTDE